MAQSFTLAPAHLRPTWLVCTLLVMAALLIGIHLYFARQAQRIRLEVTPAELVIRGSIYGRRIPLSALRVEAARVVDLDREVSYRPRWRTNGVGLPGYSAGWFRLRNGEKALAFLTAGRAAYVPTTLGFSLLVSVPEPAALLASLGLRPAGAGGRGPDGGEEPVP